MKEKITEKIKEFIKIIESSDNIVGFTGAGISTESGIPDYRSKGGIWDKFRPVFIDEFLSSEEKRNIYWERKIELWNSMINSKPGKTHLFFKELYDRKKLKGLITQNIDGLHEKSGLDTDVIVNLHGTNLKTRCFSCGNINLSEEIFKDLDLSKGTPRCSECGGIIKPDTISFGQALNEEDLKRASVLSENCDLMITAGTSLVVQPAASFPIMAKRKGAFLVIITISKTPLDVYADMVFHIKLGEFWDIFDKKYNY